VANRFYGPGALVLESEQFNPGYVDHSAGGRRGMFPDVGLELTAMKPVNASHFPPYTISHDYLDVMTISKP
jgi:hypothetical protein